jgi:hypothetical protein
MNDNKDDDLFANLAFVKALVSEGGRAQASTGAAFLTAGVCYGVQCVLQWAQIMGWLPGGQVLSLTFGIAPTVIFACILTVVLWRDRKNSQQGVATRALNATFGSAGLTNLVIMVVFGYNALVEKSMMIWLFYPCMVCALQGTVWYVAYMIRKKLWLALVSGGWFLTTLALGFAIHNTTIYVLVLGLALLFLMGGSGWYMMRQAKAG